MEAKVTCDMVTDDHVTASKMAHGIDHNDRIYIANYMAEDDRSLDIGVTPEKAIKFAEELIDMSKTMIHDRDNFKAEIKGLEHSNTLGVGYTQVSKHIDSSTVEIYTHDLEGSASIFLNSAGIDSLIDKLTQAKNFGSK